MAKEILEQVLGLLTGLSDKEIIKVHKKTRPRRIRLTPIEETRSRQTQYKRDLTSGKALYGEKVR